MHEKRIRKGMKLSILAGFLALIMAMTAFADPVLDMGETGKITVNMKADSGEALAGGEMAIYKVADVYGVGGTESTGGGYYFRLTDNFKDSRVELEGKTDDDLNGKWSEYAEKLADFADENSVEPDETKSIGADGTAVFGNLSAGLYLLVQTEPAEGYSSVNPFLVSMPYYEDGEYKTSVDTYPKTGPVEERHYFDIDEEIVTDTDDIFDTDAWVDHESVNEFEAIEIEMSTTLPQISGYDMAHGEITMNFHEVLDPELLLDEETADFTVYIAGEPISPAYYRIVFDDDTGDDCNFHVDVDLTALYNDGIVTDEMLDGDTAITIFFYVDLEYTDEKNTYTSTVWYEVYDGYEEETRVQLHQSDPAVIYVYTFEIDIAKSNSLTGAPLSGATFELYYDDAFTREVTRDGSVYTASSGDDGKAIFYGLAANTYYLKETKAPDGFILIDEPIEIIVQDEEIGDQTVTFSVTNEPTEPEYPAKSSNISYGSSVYVGDEIIYTITYYNDYAEAKDMVIVDKLASALDFVSASDGGIYDPVDHTVTWAVNVPANTVGRVTLTVKVNDSAVSGGTISNIASVAVGDDEPEDTNDVETSIGTDDNNGGNGGTSGHHSTGGGGGGGGGSGSGSGGTTVGGPGSGDGSSDGDSGTNIWDLLPLPQTGQGWALMIAICAMIVAGVGLIVAFTVRRKE